MGRVDDKIAVRVLRPLSRRRRRSPPSRPARTEGRVDDRPHHLVPTCLSRPPDGHHRDVHRLSQRITVQGRRSRDAPDHQRPDDGHRERRAGHGGAARRAGGLRPHARGAARMAERYAADLVGAGRGRQRRHEPDRANRRSDPESDRDPVRRPPTPPRPSRGSERRATLRRRGGRQGPDRRAARRLGGAAA